MHACFIVTDERLRPTRLHLNSSHTGNENCNRIYESDNMNVANSQQTLNVIVVHAQRDALLPLGVRNLTIELVGGLANFEHVAADKDLNAATVGGPIDSIARKRKAIDHFFPFGSNLAKHELVQ